MAVLLIIAAVAAILVATLIILALLLARKRSRYSHLPSPPLASFWFGHVPIIMDKEKDGVPYALVILEFSNKHGRVFVLWLAHVVVVTVSDSKAARQIVQDRTNLKPSFVFRTARYTYGNRFTGNLQEGLNDLELWSRRHKLGTAFLSKSNLRESVVVQFNQVVDKFIEYIDKATKRGELLPTIDAIHILTTAVYVVTAVGTDFETIEEFRPFYIACDNLTACAYEQMENPLSEYLPSQDVRKRAKENCAYLRETASGWIQKRQRKILEGEDYGNDLLSNVLKATASSGEYRMEDIIDIVLEYYIGSYKNVGLTMIYALREILRNPNIEKHVVKEVDQVLEGRQFVSPTDLMSLRYLINVWKEALRRHPPVTSVNRELTSDFTACGYRIPAGTWIDIGVFSMQLNEEYWPDPFVFNPDRFASLGDDASGLPFMPFSSGLRRCVGMAYTDQVGRITLARLFQTYNIQLEQSGVDHDEYRLKFPLLAPRHPINCKFEKRLEIQ